MPCEEKIRLLRDYSFALSDYERVSKLLNERTGVMAKEDYEGIRVFAAKAKKLAEEARLALDRHTAEHGC